MTTRQPPAFTILYMYYTGGTEMPQSLHMHPAATRYVLSELHRGRLENSLHQERTHAEWFSHSKYSDSWLVLRIKDVRRQNRGKWKGHVCHETSNPGHLACAASPQLINQPHRGGTRLGSGERGYISWCTQCSQMHVWSTELWLLAKCFHLRSENMTA